MKTLFLVLKKKTIFFETDDGKEFIHTTFQKFRNNNTIKENPRKTSLGVFLKKDLIKA